MVQSTEIPTMLAGYIATIIGLLLVTAVMVLSTTFDIRTANKSLRHRHF
jgi:hypothetical protein